MYLSPLFTQEIFNQGLSTRKPGVENVKDYLQNILMLFGESLSHPSFSLIKNLSLPCWFVYFLAKKMRESRVLTFLNQRLKILFIQARFS